MMFLMKGAAKVAILANVMGRHEINLHAVKRRGIRDVTLDHLIQDPSKKLVLLCLYDGSEFSVSPTLLSTQHPLAKLGGHEMGIVFETDISGSIFASCVHVNATPTAAAMIRDAYDIFED
jgi:homoserine dehydrogenase